MSCLVAQINVGLFGDEQGHDVRPALLWGEVQGRDALQGLGVGRGPALQQTAGHLHLVLLGGDVQGCVTVLDTETGSWVLVIRTCSSMLTESLLIKESDLKRRGLWAWFMTSQTVWGEKTLRWTRKERKISVSSLFWKQDNRKESVFDFAGGRSFCAETKWKQIHPENVKCRCAMCKFVALCREATDANVCQF